MRSFIIGAVVALATAAAVLYYFGHIKIEVSSKPAKPTAVSRTPLEVSGIVVDRDRKDGKPLVLVADEEAGRYFSCSDSDAPAVASNKAPLVKYFEIGDCLEYKIKNASAATDFESIEMIRANEYLILSESLRALVAAHGKTNSNKATLFSEGTLKAQYYNAYSEVGGHGLEGVVVRNDANLGHQIVGLWEGGYPEHKRMVEELSGEDCPPPLTKVVKPDANGKDITSYYCRNVGLDATALDPVLIVTNKPIVLIGDETVGIERGDGEDENAREAPIILPVPAINGPVATLNNRFNQRFRATDLVWNRSTTDQSDYIILASTAPDRAKYKVFDDKGKKVVEDDEQKTERTDFVYTCLFEVSAKGETGRSLLIKDISDGDNSNGKVPTGQTNIKNLAAANWEGLAWYGDNQLVIVNDNGGDIKWEPALTALVVSGPDDWSKGKSCDNL